MVGITGSLAMNNSKNADDIDLLVITQSNRLWLTRPLAVILLVLFGLKVRRFGQTQVTNRVCLNMFIEENDLEIQEKNQFTAHEIAQILPIYQKDNLYSKLIYSNQWINHFLVNYSLPPKPNKISSANVQYNNILIYYLNQLFYVLQKRYMQAKQTREVVFLHRAAFHPTILDAKIRNRFLTRLTNLNKIANGRVE